MRSVSQPLTCPFPPLPSSLKRPATVSHSHPFNIPSAISTSATSSPRLRPEPAGDSAAAAFWDYQFLFVSQRSESPTPVLLPPLEGSVPADFPSGTYYLAGPGLFSDDHGSTVHPLDGHGYLRAFDFSGAGGEVRYSARYVETEAQREEMDGENGRWRFTHRGPFSVLRGGKRIGNVKVMKNVANTGVVSWGGRLLCLWEGGDPYEIDPTTLATIGTVDLIDGGDRTADEHWKSLWAGELREFGLDVAAQLLKPILQGFFNMRPKRLLSHYKIDAKHGRLLFLSCNAEDMLLPRSNFTFYEFDGDFKLKQRKEFIVPDHLMIHDWAFTESHYILIGNRIKLDVPGSLLAISGLYPMVSALSVNPSQPTTPIYLLPRFSDQTNCQRDWRKPIEAPSQLWFVHIGNSFEEKEADDGGGGGGDATEIQIQAAACSYRWFHFHKMFGYDWRRGRLDPSFMNAEGGKESLLPHIVKVSIRLDPRGACKQCAVAEPSKQWSRSADFPAINPAFSGRKNTYVYAGTSSGYRRFLPHFPFDTVVKINCSDGSVASWWAGERRFVGEPLFVPKGTQEDDGYILVVEYVVSKQTCNLVILDGRKIGEADAVKAKLGVPKHLNFPLGFHGFWASR